MISPRSLLVSLDRLSHMDHLSCHRGRSRLPPDDGPDEVSTKKFEFVGKHRSVGDVRVPQRGEKTISP